jgi:hypothetical protein
MGQSLVSAYALILTTAAPQLSSSPNSSTLSSSLKKSCPHFQRQKDAVIMVSFYPGVLRCDGSNTSVSDVAGSEIECCENRSRNR